MARTLKLRRVGGSLGIVIPKSIAEKMALKEGDELYYTVTADSLELTTLDPEFDAALENARKYMREHRNTFKRLAE